MDKTNRSILNPEHKLHGLESNLPSKPILTVGYTRKSECEETTYVIIIHKHCENNNTFVKINKTMRKLLWP